MFKFSLITLKVRFGSYSFSIIFVLSANSPENVIQPTSSYCVMNIQLSTLLVFCELESHKQLVFVDTVKSSSSRHSSTSKNTSTSNSGGEVDRDYRHHKDFCDRDYRNRFSAGDRDYKDIDYRNTGAISKPYKNNNIKRSISSDKDYRSLNTSTNASHAVTNHMNTGNVPSKKDNYVPSTGKFYDYSSWNSTSNSHKDTKNLNGTTADSSKKTSEGTRF